MNTSSPQAGPKQCKHRGNYWLGIGLLTIGTVLLLRQFGVIFPFWLFKWYTILFAIGLFIGLRNGFRDKGSIILMAIGVVFFLNDYYDEFPFRDYLIPGIVIGLGLFILLRSNRTGKPRRVERFQSNTTTATLTPGNDPLTPASDFSSQAISPEATKENNYSNINAGSDPVKDEATVNGDDVFEIVTVFGSAKRLVVSKSFKGGEIVSIFGGSEVNFIQADFQNIVEVEVVAIFGGSKLIVPSNWNVRSEAVAVFGGVEDKRDAHVIRDMNKTLVLKGSTIFGGIEITSYA